MMDLAGNPAYLLEEDLSNLRSINRYLGAYRGVLRCLEYLVMERGATAFSLLDVGTGSGDIPVAIVRWAKDKGIAVKIVALESEPVTAAMAQRLTRDIPEISIVRGDALRPPFAPASFDFVLSSQLLHHFSEGEIIILMKEWSKFARKAILISDLIRHPLAYFGIRLLTLLFSRNEMTRTDGPLSVRRAFTLDEWRELFGRSGLGDFRLFTLFPFRVTGFIPLGG